MEKLEKILELENYKKIKIEERSENKKMIKIINIETKNKKTKMSIMWKIYE